MTPSSASMCPPIVHMPSRGIYSSARHHPLFTSSIVLLPEHERPADIDPLLEVSKEGDFVVMGFGGTVIPHSSCKEAYLQWLVNTSKSSSYTMSDAKEMYRVKSRQIQEELKKRTIERKHEIEQRLRASTKYVEDTKWESLCIKATDFAELMTSALGKRRCGEVYDVSLPACKLQLYAEVVHAVVAGEHTKKQYISIQCQAGYKQIFPVKLLD